MEIENLINKNDISNACSKIIGIGLYSNNYITAQKIILKYKENNNLDVKGCVITALSNIARRFGKITLESQEFLNSIIVKCDSNQIIIGLAQDAIDDLNHFTQHL